jgi:hypothetical protein
MAADTLTVGTWLRRRSEPEVALDDGRVVRVAHDVRLHDIRHLRAGQRIRIRILDGVVTEVWWPTVAPEQEPGVHMKEGDR